MKTKFVFLASILALSLLLSACGPTTIYTKAEPAMRTITVTGSGRVTMTPDMATIFISVQTQDASAAKAMQDNTSRAQTVIAAIKSFGVDARDIQTTNFSISPQDVYDDNFNVIGTTYLVQNTVFVTVRDLGTLGSLLDGVFEAGANNIYGISFDVADRTEAISQARLAAVENARRQADELAAATGVTVGDVQTITYYDSTPSPVMYEIRAAADVSSSVPVEAGSLEITTTVTIIYEIK